MFKVILSSQAKDDFKNIYNYIADDSPKIGRQFVEALHKGVKSLARAPRRCPTAPENGLDGEEIRHWLYKSYRVIFAIRGKQVYIIEIRHGARLPFNESDS